MPKRPLPESRAFSSGSGGAKTWRGSGVAFGGGSGGPLPWTASGGPRRGPSAAQLGGGDASHTSPHSRHRDARFRAGGSSSHLGASAGGSGGAAALGARSEPHGGGGDGAAGAVCALIESRAREVGLAALHRRSLEFELTQYCDRGNYCRTVSAILTLQPSVLLVSRTARGTYLLHVLEEALQAAGLPEPLFAERRHFDEVFGQDLLEKGNVAGLHASEFAAKFVACASLSALWRFVESSMGLRLNTNCVQITYRAASDTMAIDCTTAKLLELVTDARYHRERGSIFSLFQCKTPGGARLLRQSLLQPLATKAAIEERQAAVDVLLNNESLFYEIQRLLPAVGDVDLLAARLATEPKAHGQQWCKAAVRTAIRLRHALAALPQMAEALQAPGVDKSAILKEACGVFRHARFPALLEELDRVLDSEGPSAMEGKGSLAHVVLMYAVRPSVSPLLDVARQAWNDALEQIHAMHRSYCLKFAELNVKLEFTERRGWYLSHLPNGAPADFLRTEAKGTSGRHMSTTRELNCENFKLRQAEREILRQTVTVLGGLYNVLRAEAPLLYQVSHTASSLDLVQAFVSYTLLLGTYTRPVITDDPSAPIAIKGGRHPLIEKILLRDEGCSGFEPFDYLIGKDCHFQTVTGANGGGKSTYLQTLAELVILAQIGCYIPAQQATLRIVSSLFTRIGTSDNVEASASTFLVEMQEAAHILRDAMPESLVLVDELGRGTAHLDGIALCWAVCERLLELQTYTLFATHFYEICRLQAVFPGWRNMYLRSLTGGGAEGEGRLDVPKQHFAVHHATSLERLLEAPGVRYGLAAAEQVGLPDALLRSARDMAGKVEEQLVVALPYGRGGGEEEPPEVRCARQLLDLASRNNLPRSLVADVIRQLQRPWLERIAEREEPAEEAA